MVFGQSQTAMGKAATTEHLRGPDGQAVCGAEGKRTGLLMWNDRKMVTCKRCLSKSGEYKLGTYNGCTQMGKCNCCSERKVLRREPSLGAYVFLCKPCFQKVSQD